jgi:hypothetical protein
MSWKRGGGFPSTLRTTYQLRLRLSGSIGVPTVVVNTMPSSTQRDPAEPLFALSRTMSAKCLDAGTGNTR